MSCDLCVARATLQVLIIREPSQSSPSRSLTRSPKINWYITVKVSTILSNLPIYHSECSNLHVKPAFSTDFNLRIYVIPHGEDMNAIRRFDISAEYLFRLAFVATTKLFPGRGQTKNHPLSVIHEIDAATLRSIEVLKL